MFYTRIAEKNGKLSYTLRLVIVDLGSWPKLKAAP